MDRILVFLFYNNFFLEFIERVSESENYLVMLFSWSIASFCFSAFFLRILYLTATVYMLSEKLSDSCLDYVCFVE